MNNNSMKTIMVLALTTSLSAPAFSQNSATVTDEIIVTATKRAQSAQDVPMAISVFSGEMIENIGAQNVSDLVDSIPGVELRATEEGQGGFAFRGISEQVVTAGTSGATAGFYLDEVPLTVAGQLPDVKSFDVERVEVLKGPQGTLFGEGSMTGVVRLIMNKPDTKAFSARADLTYSDTKGGADTKTANLMVNIPVSETFAIRGVGFYNDAGGFIDRVDWNAGTPRETNANFSETKGGRITARWTPNDDLTVTGMAMHSTADRGGNSIGNANFVEAVSTDIRTEDEFSIFNLTVEYSLPFADIVSSSSYFDKESVRTNDLAPFIPTLDSVFGVAGIGPFSTVFSDENINTEAFTQEIRLVSNGDGPLKWTLGVFYKSLDHSFQFEGLTGPVVSADDINAVSDFFQEFVFGIPAAGIVPIRDLYVFDTQGQITQKAVFSEISYDLSDDLEVLVGLRLFKDDRESVHLDDGLFPLLAGGTFPDSYVTKGDENVTSPKFTIKYNLNDNTTTYFTYSEGFRSGGQNDFFSLVPGAKESFDSERLTNYEIGLKGSWLGNKLVANLSAYYMNWNDIQLDVAQAQGGLADVADNAGDARSIGAELDARARLSDSLDWTFGVSILNAETLNVIDLPNLGETVPKGTQIPGTAKFQLSTALQYRFDIQENIGGFARLGYSHTSSSRSSIFSNVVNPSQDIVDARLGVELEDFQLTVFVDNLLNENIIVDDIDFAQPFVGNVFVHGRPRTIGINVRKDF